MFKGILISVIISLLLSFGASAKAQAEPGAVNQIIEAHLLNRVPYSRFRYQCKFEDARVFLQGDNDQNFTAIWKTDGEIEDFCKPSEDEIDAGQHFWTHSYFTLNNQCSIRLPRFVGFFYRAAFRPKSLENGPKVDRDFNPAPAGDKSRTFKYEVFSATLIIQGEKIKGQCYEEGYQQDGGAGSRGN